MKPLIDTTILLCSHDLVAANIGLRLSQLGADVVRVVDKSEGDTLKKQAYYNQFSGGSSLLYHTKTRGQRSLEIETQSESERANIWALLSSADVVVFDYNDNILDKMGIETQELRQELPSLIVAEYSAYGSHTLYRDRQGDDIIAQALSGITLLTGDRDDAPTPMGLKIPTLFCASYLTQGILSALYRRELSGGLACKVSSSLLEAILQVQLEVITTSANDGMQMATRAKQGNAHAALPAPYGLYRSADGYFAMSMVSIPLLAEVMGVEIPREWIDRPAWLWYRDEIMESLAPHFLKRSNREWMELFTPLDIWCSDVYDLQTTLKLEAYTILDLEERLSLPSGESITTTKCPYKIDFNPCERVDGGSGSSSYQVSDKPLDGILVVDISQYLSGPTSTLQLGDLGATVVKIERPRVGDMGRNVIISNLLLDDTSTSFLAVGRNKRSAALDLKDEQDRAMVKVLMRQADVIVQNFRPAVMKRLGLDYEAIKEINPRVIYAEVSGYGKSGCWVSKPGQDYIVQALSGLCALSGHRGRPPIPMGLSVVDLISGCHVDEAVTAALLNRARRGDGAHIQVTMFGSAMDLQSDIITAYRWDNSTGGARHIVNSHPGVDAPYGIYATKDGHIAISAAPLSALVDEVPTIETTDWGERQSIIMSAVAKSILTETTQYWISKLEGVEGAMCSEILGWRELFSTHYGESLEMLQRVERSRGFCYTTTRCPVRINDTILRYERGAPYVGEYTEQIIKRYDLDI